MTRRRGRDATGSDPRGDDHFGLEVIEMESLDASGSGRDPAVEKGPPRRRGPAIVAVLVAVALVGFAMVDHSHHPSRSAGTTATTNAGRTNINLNDLPAGRRPLFPFLVGTTVLTANDSGLRLVDTDTGAVTPLEVRDLPLGPVTIVAHSGGTVAVQSGADLYWFTTAERVAHIATSEDATTAFASARPGHLWLASEHFAAEVPDGPGLATVATAIGATKAGLLVPTSSGIILQPTRGAAPTPRLFLPKSATVIGVHADRVAWTDVGECGVLRCPVHISEVAKPVTSTWMQLVGSPRPDAILRAHGVFSADGNSLAVAIPNDALARVETVEVTDLQTRATRVVEADGRFELPARPGTGDATGETFDWTPDGNFLVFAPSVASGSTRLGAIDPFVARMYASNANLDAGTTAAAVAASANGPPDLPARSHQPVATGGPTRIGLTGLELLAADEQQVDVLDLGTNIVNSYLLGGRVLNPPEQSSIARVTGGWLVVRDGVVNFVSDAGGPVPSHIVDTGSRVFSANHGRDAWIAIASRTPWHVRSYDPATGAVGAPIAVDGTVVGAVDAGAVVVTLTPSGSRMDIIDRSGHVRNAKTFEADVMSLQVVAAAGTTIAYRVGGGFHTFDLANGNDRQFTTQSVAAAALSPDGKSLAWIESGSVSALRLSTATVEQLGAGGKRVVVADDGTVLFTTASGVNRGRVDATGSTRVYGLAPDPSAVLALG